MLYLDGIRQGDGLVVVSASADENPKFVDTIPDAADAENGVIYVKNSDLSSWAKSEEGITVPATITHAPFTDYFPDYTNRGVHQNDSGVSSPVRDDIFFSLSRDSFRLYNGNAWVDRNVQQVTTSTHLAIGIGTGNPPIAIDTPEELAATLAVVGFASAYTYLAYIASEGSIRQVTSFTPAGTQYRMINLIGESRAYLVAEMTVPDGDLTTAFLGGWTKGALAPATVVLSTVNDIPNSRVEVPRFGLFQNHIGYMLDLESDGVLEVCSFFPLRQAGGVNGANPVDYRSGGGVEFDVEYALSQHVFDTNDVFTVQSTKVQTVASSPVLKFKVYAVK